MPVHGIARVFRHDYYLVSAPVLQAWPDGLMPLSPPRPGLWRECGAKQEETRVDQDGELRRLRWRSRRGMRELDQLFNRWLDQRYAQASEAERGVFLLLLDCEDDRLWKWFLGHERPADAELDALVQSIRALPPAG
jgi:antitoxin CptB